MARALRTYWSTGLLRTYGEAQIQRRAGGSAMADEVEPGTSAGSSPQAGTEGTAEAAAPDAGDQGAATAGGADDAGAPATATGTGTETESPPAKSPGILGRAEQRVAIALIA